MVAIPKKIVNCRLSTILLNSGLERIKQGKCRDIFALPGYQDLLLFLTTKRISIFDFTLNALVEGKGEAITAFTVFFMTEVLKRTANHIKVYGSAIDKCLPSGLRGIKDLQSSAMVVENRKLLPVEFVVRGYLTGSAWDSYQKSGEVCGNKLPKGLRNGDKLAEPIFTPTTKSPKGHDMPLRALDVVYQYGSLTKNLSFSIYSSLAEYLESRGFILADIKFEFDEAGVLLDEISPDSFRLWKKDEWEEAMSEGRLPAPYDKQFVRNWGLGLSYNGLKMNQLDPENPEHIAWVHQQEVPEQVLYNTSALYQQTFKEVSGCDLEYFQKFKMKIGGKWDL